MGNAPEEQKEGRVLNKIVRITEHGWEYEPDQSHADMIIEAMGLQVHCGARTESFMGEDGTTDMESMSPVSALRFSNEGWDDLDVQMVVVSAGIKPRDEIARSGTTPEGSIATRGEWHVPVALYEGRGCADLHG